MATARPGHRHQVGAARGRGTASSRIAPLVALNESLAIAGHALAGRKARGQFVCECGSVSCRGFVRLALSEYERIRRRRALLLLVGHEVQA
jgi:hypothetical protein